MALHGIRGGVMGADEYRVLNKPRVSVYRAAALNIANATGTAIPWDTKEYDTDSMWDGANAIFAKTPGAYLFCGQAGFANAAGGYRSIQFRKNGVGAFGLVSDPSPTVVSYSELTTSAIISLNAGDYVDFAVVQTSGGALLFDPATLANRVNGLQACLISTIG